MKKRYCILLWCYQLVLSLSIVIAGICLAAQCLQLYFSGPRPFSAESVAAAFAEIAVPVYLCGLLAAAGILLRPLLPAPKAKLPRNDALILTRLESTVDLNACPQLLQSAVTRLLLVRAVVQYIGWALLAASAAVFLLYGADPANYDPANINGSMLYAAVRLLLCMAVPFFYAVFAAYYRRRSVRREIDLLKTAPAEAKVPPEPDIKLHPSTLWLRSCILGLGLLLVLGGYLMGGAVDVLTKAVNICTECIGLG